MGELDEVNEEEIDNLKHLLRQALEQAEAVNMNCEGGYMCDHLLDEIRDALNIPRPKPIVLPIEAVEELPGDCADCKTTFTGNELLRLHDNDGKPLLLCAKCYYVRAEKVK